MKRQQAKFVISSVLIILAVMYLGYSGYQQTRAYCYSVPTLIALNEAAYGQRLQVAGIVNVGSIQRYAGEIDFLIGQEPQTLLVRYIGKDAPDTLVDGAEALATGTLGRDGIFVADIVSVTFSSKQEHSHHVPSCAA